MLSKLELLVFRMKLLNNKRLCKHTKKTSLLLHTAYLYTSGTNKTGKSIANFPALLN